MPSGFSERPAGVYVHFPFCASRCGYCDFVSLAGRDDWVEPYLRSLGSEIERLQQGAPREADTIYLGGGTPSRMTPAQVGAILDAAAARFVLSSDLEITLEGNPESLTSERLAGYRAAGVTRMSIGVQSMDDRVLRLAGRAHDSRQARDALSRARGAGFRNVSLDLIAGLPGEDLSRWKETVSSAAALAPDHISVYLIEADKETPLASAIRKGGTPPPDDDALAEAYEKTVQALEASGFPLYEISNFAPEAFRSRHNLKYWTDAPFAGFGLGAHAYFRGERRANHRSLERYIADVSSGKDPVASTDAWSGERRAAEALVLGLRLAEGVDVAEIESRYGADLRASQAEAWSRAADAGLVEWDGSRVRLTPPGRLRSNELFADLI